MKSKIILAVLILLAIFSCRRKSSEDYNYYKPYVSDSLSVADTIQTVITPDTTSTVEVKKDEFKGVDLNDNFFIVVASYVVEEYAEAQKKELTSQGYKPQVFMINEDGWYKLAVESYANYSEALTGLAEVKNRGGIFGTAVIVSKKSK